MSHLLLLFSLLDKGNMLALFRCWCRNLVFMPQTFWLPCTYVHFKFCVKVFCVCVVATFYMHSGGVVCVHLVLM